MVSQGEDNHYLNDLFTLNCTSLLGYNMYFSNGTELVRKLVKTKIQYKKRGRVCESVIWKRRDTTKDDFFY